MNTLRPRPGAQNMGRMISHGMNVEDFMELTRRTECNCDCNGKTFEMVPMDQREDFCLVATELGDRNTAYAEKMEAEGNILTAANFYSRACACYRIADYALHGLDDERVNVYQKLLATFKRSKELSSDNFEIIEIPFEDTSIPAYFCIPDNCPSDTPVLVFIPGATGFKEENYASAYAFYQRGIPFIIFDGPGQGESLYFRKMFYTVDNYEKACKAVIDFVKADDRVGDKVALYGISYGGYLAARCACFLNDDICGLIVRGGCAKTDDLTRHPWVGKEDFYLYGFMEKFNEYDIEKAKEISSAMTCEDYLSNITVPTLIIHSAVDPILGTEGAKKIYNDISSTDKYYAEFPGGSHCCMDQHDTVSQLAADWMGKRMRG